MPSHVIHSFRLIANRSRRRRHRSAVRTYMLSFCAAVRSSPARHTESMSRRQCVWWCMQVCLVYYYCHSFGCIVHISAFTCHTWMVTIMSTQRSNGINLKLAGWVAAVVIHCGIQTAISMRRCAPVQSHLPSVYRNDSDRIYIGHKQYVCFVHNLGDAQVCCRLPVLRTYILMMNL